METVTRSVTTPAPIKTSGESDPWNTADMGADSRSGERWFNPQCRCTQTAEMAVVPRAFRDRRVQRVKGSEPSLPGRRRWHISSDR